MSVGVKSMGPQEMARAAEAASGLLKALAHPGRLSILCYLSDGEQSVSALEARLGLRQAAVSQLLARLREDDLVSTRREGKIVYYRLSDPSARAVIETLYGIYCVPPSPEQAASDT